MASQVICPHAGTARLRTRLKGRAPHLLLISASAAVHWAAFKLHACSTKASGI